MQFFGYGCLTSYATDLSETMFLAEMCRVENYVHGVKDKARYASQNLLHAVHCAADMCGVIGRLPCQATAWIRSVAILRIRRRAWCR